jgi:hypothetical protein
MRQYDMLVNITILRLVCSLRAANNNTPPPPTQQSGAANPSSTDSRSGKTDYRSFFALVRLFRDAN